MNARQGIWVLSGDSAVMYVFSDNSICALDTVKGTVKWKYTTGDQVSCEQLWA